MYQFNLILPAFLLTSVVIFVTLDCTTGKEDVKESVDEDMTKSVNSTCVGVAKDNSTCMDEEDVYFLNLDSKNVEVDECLMTYLETPKPFKPPLLRCFRFKCEQPKSQGVTGLFFNFEGKHYEDPTEGLIEDFQKFSSDPYGCTAFLNDSQCVVNSIRTANRTMGNGTIVDLSVFWNAMDMSTVLLTNQAFCVGNETVKQMFYDFLREGGQGCVMSEGFSTGIVSCLVDSDDRSLILDLPTDKFWTGVKKCVPPLIRECENGEKLEQLLTQGFLHQVDTVYETLWRGLTVHGTDQH